MNFTTNRRRSLILLAVVVIILWILTALFYRKVTAMLNAENELNLISISEQYARSFEKSLQNALNYLGGVAKLAGFEQNDINWNSVESALANPPFPFSRSGVVDLQGSGIIGPGVFIGSHQGLQQAFRGYSTITALAHKEGSPRSFLLAVPIMLGQNVKFALYGVFEEEQLYDMLSGIVDRNGAVSFIIDENEEPILPLENDELRAKFAGWMANPSQHGLEKNLQNLRNKLKRYKKGVERIRSAQGDDYYLDVVPMRLNDWQLVSLIPGHETQKRVNAIAKLFLLVFGALLLLFIIVLAYSQMADAAYRARLYSLAYVDRLTGLPNWEKVKLDLPALMNAEKRVKNWLLVTFDVKHFKYINEMFGYRGGDDILGQIAAGLKEPGDDGARLPFRHENDCFAYLVPGDGDAAVEKIRERLDRLSRDGDVGTHRLRFSCGACVIPAAAEGGHDWNGYMNSARLAREQSKKLSDTGVSLYDNALKQRLVHAQQLQSDMEEALADEDFEMYLQPKYAIALRDRERLTGAEALIRWNHKTRGFLSPAMFIPIFEEDGSIGKLDRFIFTKACQCISRWVKHGKRALPVSVNLSRVQLSNPNLSEELSEIADRHGVPHRLVDIELTESASFDDMQLLIRTMHQLKRHGFKLSLDDFGTGYSSLSLLRDMPMDILKLDKSFIDPWRNEDTSPSGIQFIRDIINMADHQGIQTLAEGVETVRQLEILRSVHCDIVQGYYFHRPMPVQKYEQLLTSDTISFTPGGTRAGS